MTAIDKIYRIDDGYGHRLEITLVSSSEEERDEKYKLIKNLLKGE